MAEGNVHKHLKKLALYFLKEKCVDLVANEVDFKNAYSIADAVGLNLKRKEVRVIEVKATKGDFIRDKKLFGEKTSYFVHAHYSYIMCPTDIIQPEELPHGYGLLWVDENDKIEIIKKPIKNTARLKTLFDTTLKRTSRSLTNTFLFHEENKDHKDPTEGKYSRNPLVDFIAATCPVCKKRNKYLVNIQDTEVKCSKRGCGENIDLTKARKRVITSYNNTFITKVNKLTENSLEKDN